jgi:hypothetical protein
MELGLHVAPFLKKSKKQYLKVSKKLGQKILMYTIMGSTSVKKINPKFILF